jgi:proteic killer suppression protein
MAIVSFDQSDLEPLLRKGVCPPWIPADIRKRTHTKLIVLDAAETLQDLRSPPGNHLEALAGDLAGFHSIRVNRQWRLIFVWTAAGPSRVALVDYHS